MSKKKKEKIHPPNSLEKRFPKEFSVWIYISILFVIFLITYAFVFDSKIDLNGDNANYMLLAKSIFSGNGYSDLWTPGLPSVNHFPPGYPFLLSVAMFVVGNNHFAFQIINGAFFFTSIVVLFLLMKNVTEQVNFVFIVSILLLVNSKLYYFATIVMSESSYLFFVVATFYCIDALSNDEMPFWKSKWFYGMLISVSIAYYIRTFGLALIGAVIGYFLFTKKWKEALAFAFGTIVLQLPWILRNKMLGLESSYMNIVMRENAWRPEEGTMSTAGDFIDRILKNFDEVVIKAVSNVIFPFVNFNYDVPSDILLGSIGLIVFGIILYGAWNFSRVRWMVIFFILASIGILLIWQGGNGSRYVTPLTPILVFCFFYGVWKGIGLIMKKELTDTSMRSVPYFFIVLVFFMFSPLKTMNATAKMPYPPAYKNFFDIAKKVKTTTSDTVVICNRKPTLFYIFGERFSVNYAYTLDDKILLTDLINKKVDYVVLEQLGYGSTQRYLYPAIQKHPNLFEVKTALKNPDTYLLKFDRKRAREELMSTAAPSENKNGSEK